jgi:hypothetical protein
LSAAVLAVLLLAACLDLSSLPGPPRGTPGAPDGGDQLATTFSGTLAAGEPVSGTIGGLYEAHNWAFEGAAGQTVTITAAGEGGADPHAALIGPDGATLAEDDDSGEGSAARIELALPADGVYTVRIDLLVTGAYTLRLDRR